MSYASVGQQLALLLGQTPGIQTVLRSDGLRLGKRGSVTLQRDQCPGVMVVRGISRETIITNASNERVTPFIVGVFFYGDAADDDLDADRFNDLLETLQQQVRHHPQFDGKANTQTATALTAVLWTQIKTSEPLPRPFSTTGNVPLYHDKFLCEVHEEIRAL